MSDPHLRCYSTTDFPLEPGEPITMITIEMPGWAMWLLGTVLLINVVTVATDVMVRLKTYRILLHRDSK